MKSAKLLIICLATFAAAWAWGAVACYVVHYLAHANGVTSQQHAWAKAFSESWAFSFGSAIGLTTVLWAKNRNKIGQKV